MLSESSMKIIFNESRGRFAILGKRSTSHRKALLFEIASQELGLCLLTRPIKTFYSDKLCRHDYCPAFAYLASVASLAGRHQSSLSRYQRIVSSSPDAKSVCLGLQPSSVRSLVGSIA